MNNTTNKTEITRWNEIESLIMVVSGAGVSAFFLFVLVFRLLDTAVALLSGAPTGTP
jgi:hypothetical protein